MLILHPWAKHRKTRVFLFKTDGETEAQRGKGMYQEHRAELDLEHRPPGSPEGFVLGGLWG